MDKAYKTEAAVDGILVCIQKSQFNIVGEKQKEAQSLSGYDVIITVPKWPKNISLLRDISRGYESQQSMIAKLRKGANRKWIMERFVEIDKTIAKSFRGNYRKN